MSNIILLKENNDKTVRCNKVNDKKERDRQAKKNRQPGIQNKQSEKERKSVI